MNTQEKNTNIDNNINNNMNINENLQASQTNDEITTQANNNEEEIAATTIGCVLPYTPTGEYTVEKIDKVPKKPFYSFIKKTFDFVSCSLALLLLSPLFLIVAIIIKCSSKGPVFYKQERLGLNGKKFNLVKFRSMRVDAEKDGAQWSNGDEDNRIYPFGRFLRKTRIDELPQLWCCVTGKMSLIGPRPEREIFYNEFEKYIHGFSERLKIKPGLTGLAQINGGYDLKPEEKIVYDIEYIQKRSIWLDIKILFKTIAVIFNHDGAK